MRISIRGNSVTLSGSVALYATREEAEEQVGHIRGIGLVHNEIQVDTPAIPDAKLQKNLETAMAARIDRRLGFVPDFSGLISVHVHSGVVILEGHLPSVQLERDVFDAVAQTKGVREIIDHIQSGSNPELDTLRTPGLGTDAGAAAGNMQGPSVGTGIHRCDHAVKDDRA